MKPMEYNYFLITILAMFMVSNVATAAVPVFGTNSESQYARDFSPPQGKAVIYIYQRKEDGRGVSPSIKLNNYVIGRLVPGSFTVWKLSAGQVTIQVAGVKTVGYSFKTKPGAIYRFRLIVKQTSAGARAELRFMSTSGQNDILGTRLLKNPKSVTNSTKSAPVIAAAPIAPKVTQPVKPAPPPAPKQTPKPAPEPTPEAKQTSQSDYDGDDFSEENFGLMVKTGVMTVSNTTQFIVGEDRSFDSSTSAPTALDAYYQFASGLTVGGEYMQYTANFTSVGLSDTHEVDVTLLMATLKQYFRTDSSLQPFIGAGIGSVTTDISGPAVIGDASGLAYQLMGGIEYRFNNFGVFGEVKYINAVSKSDNEEKVDVSGIGILTGIALHF